jgi:hypothetical protein
LQSQIRKQRLCSPPSPASRPKSGRIRRLDAPTKNNPSSHLTGTTQITVRRARLRFTNRAPFWRR